MTTVNVNQAILEALTEEMRRDPRVLLLGEGVATKHHGLVTEFGATRVRNTPLAEAIIAGTAVGAAACGLRPVIDLLFAPFLTYAMDALVNSAGKLRYLSGGQFEFPLVAMALTGAGWGVGGQHNHNIEAIFAHAPGLKVVMPSTAADFKGLLKSAIRDDNPVIFFIDLALVGNEGKVAAGDAALVPIGQAAVPRTGGDITLVTYAKTVAICQTAAEELARRGMSAEVIDLRTIKPWDEAAVLRSVRKTGRLIVVHEANGVCGIGAEVAAVVASQAFDSLKAPVRRITGPDAPAPSSFVLEQAGVPEAERIVSVALELLGQQAVA